jgi:hypothetical protein
VDHWRRNNFDHLHRLYLGNGLLRKVRIMAGTIYAPGTSQSTYYKKLTQAQPAVQPAGVNAMVGTPEAAQQLLTAQQALSQQMTANGMPPGSMSMGPNGYMGGAMGAGGMMFTNQPAGGVYNGIQGNGAMGQATQGGPTIYAPGQDVYGGQVGGGPTIYAPPAQAPAPPALNSNRSSGGGVAGSVAQPTTQQLTQIAMQLQAQYDKANKANESRYGQLLGLADQQGQAAMAQNQRQTTRELGAGQASLINRGLGNSTIVDSTRRGTLNASNARADQIGNMVAQNKAGVIERRTDAGPDVGLYAQLLSQPGGAVIAQTLLDAMGTGKKKGK